MLEPCEAPAPPRRARLTTHIDVWVSPATYDAAAVRALREGLSLSCLVRVALLRYLATDETPLKL